MRRPEDPPIWPILAALIAVAAAALAALLCLDEPSISRERPVFGGLIVNLRLLATGN